jgi:hypothetical protein
VTGEAPYLAAFAAAAEEAGAAEKAYRREAAARIEALEQERAFAFRRLNLMRSVAAAVAGAEGEEIAVANAQAMLREKLGWSADSESRSAVLTRFAPVAAGAFASLRGNERAAAPDIAKMLADFEAWYAETQHASFWLLFDHYMPETPVVDF